MNASINNASIKLICFDLDDTLWDGNEVISTAQHAMFDWLLEYHPVIAEKASNGRYLEIRNTLVNKYPQRAHNLTFLRKEILRILFLENDYSDQEALENSNKAFEVFFTLRNQVSFYKGALEAITKIKKNYMVAAITNGNADIHTVGLNTQIDFFYSAEVIGAAKPDTRMFRALLEESGLMPHECIHVGDHLQHDIAAASSIGIKTIWFNPHKKKWPSENGPDHEIESFYQLISAIRKIENND